MPRDRVEKLVRDGTVHPKRDVFGRRRFDPEEIAAILKRGGPSNGAGGRPRSSSIPGAKAAAAFRLFGERRELRAIVLELELPPDAVLDLRRQYAEMGRDLLLSPGEVEQLRELLGWEGDTGRSLVARVNERLREQYRRGKRDGLTESSSSHSEQEVSSAKAIPGG